MRKSGIIAALCLCLGLFTVPSGETSSNAASPDAWWYVSTTGNDLTGTGSVTYPFRTIQHAVDMAASGDFIYIIPGVYEEHVNINSKSLTLSSSNPYQNAYIHSDTSRCLTALHSSSLYLYRLTFQGNVTTPMQNSGGAVRIEDATATLRKCILTNSRAPHNGGGLYAIDAVITVDSCEITNNRAEWTGAPYEGMKNTGGGICYWGDYLNVTNTTISGNYCGVADAYGGGVYVNGNFASFFNSDISGNTAEAVREGVTDGYEAVGGGLYIEGDESNISGSRIYGNTATARTELTGARCFGGGVSTLGGSGYFYYNVVYGNQVAAEFWEGSSEVFIESGGGGVYLQGVTLSNNTFDDNHALSNGILNYAYCDITLVASGGGAILENCVFSRNLFTNNSVSSDLTYNASCNPGCLSICDRFLLSGAGLAQTLSTNSCNIYYGNSGADEWAGTMGASTFNQNPLYCDQPGRDYYLYSNSPGLPSNNSCGLLFGAKEEGCIAFMPGDANGDEGVNVADAVYLINYVFKGGPAPNPLEAGDANCDGSPNVADAVYLINYVFKGGAAPGCF